MKCMCISLKNNMQKKYFFSGAILLLLILSYLFYRSCKRDTIVISLNERFALPDSAWLCGTVNLDQIRKEVAWSSLLNGDVFKLFKTDTTTSALLQVFRNPSDYSILEQHAIPYFSVWKDSIRYTGIIFQVTSIDRFSNEYPVDSITHFNEKRYSFRTSEGIWMYRNHNLLFIGNADNDSIFAAGILNKKNIHPVETIPDGTILLTATIRTAYIPYADNNPLLRRSSMQLFLKNNSKALQINWNYTGPAAAFLKQGRLAAEKDATGIFVAANTSLDSIQTFIQGIPYLHSFYQKKSYPLIDTLISTLNNNHLSLAFNGWKKIHSSYYTSVMNEEFEMVLQKKDTTSIEPVFKLTVSQPDKSAALRFTAYLQKQGLISAINTTGFTVVLGSFDSELKIEKDASLVLHNKHQPAESTSGSKDSINGAFAMYIHPSYISGLFDHKIKKEGFPVLDSGLKKISSIECIAAKHDRTLSGSLIVEFTDGTHPLLSFMEVLKRMTAKKNNQP